MESPRVVLSLAGHPRTWSSSSQLRIGRLPELEVGLDDLSVSRLHAEVYLIDDAWVVRDRGSSNGTILNGVRLGRTPHPVQAGDTIQVGNLVFKVEQLQTRPVTVRLGSKTVQVEAATTRRVPAVELDASDDRPAHDLRGFSRLVRGAHRLAEVSRAGDGLQQIVDGAVAFFGAQRGGVFLLDDATGQLALRCFALRPTGGRGRRARRWPRLRCAAASRCCSRTEPRPRSTSPTVPCPAR